MRRSFDPSRDVEDHRPTGIAPLLSSTVKIAFGFHIIRVAVVSQRLQPVTHYMGSRGAAQLVATMIYLHRTRRRLRTIRHSSSPATVYQTVTTVTFTVGLGRCCDRQRIQTSSQSNFSGNRVEFGAI